MEERLRRCRTQEIPGRRGPRGHPGRLRGRTYESAGLEEFFVSLVAEFSLKVPGWVSGAGRRALLPVGLFSAPEKHLFDHAERIHPVYFEFPFQRTDDISIDLPLGWQIATLPKPQKLDAKAITYTLEANNDKGTLHLNRTLNVDILMFRKQNYATMRTFSDCEDRR